MCKTYNLFEIRNGRKILHSTHSKKMIAELRKEQKIDLYKDNPEFKDSEWIVEECED